jgi:hypothetical protein
VWHRYLETIDCGVVEVYRLFYEENRGGAREPRHQLLWSLPDEVPSEMALNDKRMLARRRNLAPDIF